MRSAILVTLFLLAAAPAAAQTLDNPTTLVFLASPDHDVSDLGQPKLKDYAVEFVEPGSTVSQTLSLGKPQPDANRDITVDFAGLRSQLKVAPGQYTVRVVARGPGGEARSQPSAPFNLAILPPAAPGLPQPRKSSAQSQGPTSSASPSLTVVGLSSTAK